MKKVNGQSLNPQEELKKQLKKNFPEVFSEDGKVDPEKLKLTLGEDIELSREKYGLSWAGKSDCFREIQKTTTATLVPQKDESVNFDETENIFIEGENLEALRVLQKSYYGKIKMIYIDPPYNTGNDFVYNDSFKQDKKEYQEQIGETNGNGDLSKDTALRRNTKDSGHYHSNWLNMMYPRLFLARNLLRKDGVIFVSIDDNEVQNLRLMMNEIFGEENFVAQITWMRKRGKDNSAKFFSRNHEYLICYGKQIDEIEFSRLALSEQTRKAYRNPDNDFRGDYRLLGVWARGSQGGSKYEFIDKSGKKFSERLWLFNKSSMEKLDKDDRLVVNGDKIYRKLFLTEVSGSIPETIWFDTSNAANAADEIKSLFGNIIFDTPKPIPYLKRMLKISTNKSDVVLDFFAGSATTAHAVMDLNKEDGGNRKYIMVQLPEETDKDSEAYKAGYKNIAEIAKERIRRAGKKLTDGGKQLGLGEDSNKKLDFGFKSFKLSSSNFKEWNTEIKTEEELQKQLEVFVNHSVGGASDMAQIYELLLKNGYDLNSKIEAKEVKGKKVYLVNSGELVICLEGILERVIIDGIVKLEPAKVIFLETCFNNDDELKTNTLLQMESADIDFRVV